MTHEEQLAKRREYRANRTEYQKERDRQRRHEYWINRTELQKQKDRERGRAYYYKNKEREAERHKAFAAENRDALNAYERQWWAKQMQDPEFAEKKRAAWRAWYYANREKRLAYEKAKRQKKKEEMSAT